MPVESDILQTLLTLSMTLKNMMLSIPTDVYKDDEILVAELIYTWFRQHDKLTLDDVPKLMDCFNTTDELINTACNRGKSNLGHADRIRRISLRSQMSETLEKFKAGLNEEEKKQLQIPSPPVETSETSETNEN